MESKVKHKSKALQNLNEQSELNKAHFPVSASIWPKMVFI